MFKFLSLNKKYRVYIYNLLFRSHQKTVVTSKYWKLKRNYLGRQTWTTPVTIIEFVHRVFTVMSFYKNSTFIIVNIILTLVYPLELLL